MYSRINELQGERAVRIILGSKRVGNRVQQRFDAWHCKPGAVPGIDGRILEEANIFVIGNLEKDGSIKVLYVPTEEGGINRFDYIKPDDFDYQYYAKRYASLRNLVDSKSLNQ